MVLPLVGLETTLIGIAVGLMPASADCLSLDASFRKALANEDVQSVQQIHRSIAIESTCDGDYRERAGRLVALVIAKHSSSPDSDGSAELEVALHYGRPWQVLVALGDLYYGKQLWTDAVNLYEEAIDDMRNESLNRKPPPEVVERRLIKRVYQARALADRFIDPPIGNRGPTGSASPVYRTFSLEAVPVPVQFAYDGRALSADGKKAVSMIYSYLINNGSPLIELRGHTDPVGSDDYNDTLSIDRARAVRAYLTSLGYEAQKIRAVGFGERQRFVPDDPSLYTEEQRHAFDRRVEYRLLP